MIRKGIEQDIPHIAAIYEHIHDNEECGKSTVGWIRGVYPTADTARAALDTDDLFVMEEGGAVVAAARINKIQVPVYADVPWRYPDVPDEQVMVLHTLVVEPACTRTPQYGQVIVFAVISFLGMAFQVHSFISIILIPPQEARPHLVPNFHLHYRYLHPQIRIRGFRCHGHQSCQ